MNNELELARQRQRAARDAIRYDRAVSLMEAKSYPAALDELLEIRRLAQDAYPDQGSTPAIESRVGICFEQLGRVDEAIEAYEKTLALIEFAPNVDWELCRKPAVEGLQRLKK